MRGAGPALPVAPDLVRGDDVGGVERPTANAPLPPHRPCHPTHRRAQTSAMDAPALQPTFAVDGNRLTLLDTGPRRLDALLALIPTPA